MSVLGILLDNDVKVSHRQLMLLDHLVCFCSLMDVAQVAWDLHDALLVWEDGLLELLESAVSESEVVEDVSFVGHERVVLECFLHGLDALFVPLVGEVCQTELVENLWAVRLDLQRVVQILDSFVVVAHVVEALRPILVKLNVLRLHADCLLEAVNCVLVVLHHVVALSKAIIALRTLFIFI